MLMHHYVCQPESEYLALLEAATDAATFDSISGAFAYASSAGVSLLTNQLRADIDGFAELRKQWLVGIDWCRSEPRAFDLLEGVPNSAVKVPDGAFVVKRQGCTPRLPWHPKALVLQGPTAIAVIAGSGNLSRNGLTRGHEVGSLTVVSQPANAAERRALDSCQEVATWFTSVWRRATPLARVSVEYDQRFKTAARGKPPLTDDDKLPEERRGWSEERVRKFRTASRLWIDAGNLHHNRGENRPGNQLMLSPWTKVFFGLEPVDVPTDTALGSLAIRYGGMTRWDSPLRFSNNAMEVLTLPLPGAGGPPTYDQKPLLFTAAEQDGQPVWDLTVGTAAERRRWRNKSRAADSFYKMQNSPREWGVFP
jgi:hypothetical protein